MNLDKLAVVLRPRSNWEAIDLGARMIQSWARPLYIAWLSVYLPLAIGLVFIVGYEFNLVAWVSVVVMWLKPLFDRVILYLLSHAVFGELKNWRDAWGALPRLMWRTGLLRSLTLARLSPMRSFVQPVTQLEAQHGKPARERRRLLARQAGGAAFWLTFTMMNFELIMAIALFGLVWMMLPEQLTEDATFFTLALNRADNPSQLADFILSAVYISIVAFLEPFYVAAGFALYLKRRTDLEAWDVELALRRLPSPAAAASGAISTVAALLVAITLFVFIVPPSARAADAEPAPADSGTALQARGAIAEVLKRPEFGTEQKRWRLKYIGPEEAEHDDGWFKQLLRQIGKAFLMIGKFIAQISRVAMWVALAILVGVFAWIIYRYWRPRRIALSIRSKAPPAEVAGFDIRPESLPDDVAGAALALLRAGQSRAALSLLYRAALSALAHRDQVEFNRGDTEGDCLHRVRNASPQRFGFFEKLTRAWQEVAYASHEISLTNLEELCRVWPQHFKTAR